jgi:dye decolorizing peroxidase
VPTRRQFLALTAAAAMVSAGAGIAAERNRRSAVPPVALGRQPSGLPARQHAWDASLRRDREGNLIPPRFDRLLMLDLRTPATRDAQAELERALRTLERHYEWSPGGLLFLLGWGPRYFAELGRKTPVARPKPLSSFELPTLDAYDACLHLACDDDDRLAQVEAALLAGGQLSGTGGATDLRDVFALRETRTGFVGTGLPARHQHTGGIPSGDVVPPTAPLFMGFRSSLRRNQATEDAVTIPAGPLAGGTTMHVSYMRLRLDSWYQVLDERERVARMYAPEVTPEQARRFTADARSDPGRFSAAARRYGVVGHAQTTARARVGGRPRILRRDFNTVDGGEAGLHFVALQRSIADFVATRNAMNADRAPLLNPAITPTVNNGINEFIFVLRRGNYAVPCRAERSFPLLGDQV